MPLLFALMMLFATMNDAALDPRGWAGIVQWDATPSWLDALFSTSMGGPRLSDGGRKGERAMVFAYQFDNANSLGPAKTKGTVEFIFDDLGNLCTSRSNAVENAS